MFFQLLLVGSIILFIATVALGFYSYKLKLLLHNATQLLRDREKMIENFKDISNEVLLRNHQSFLTIATETFSKVLAEDKSEVKSIMIPIKETLALFDRKIAGIEKDRIDAYSDLRQQIKNLLIFNQEIQKETHSLSKALATPFMSGQWGEMQLRRVVEITGMMPYCDFIEQAQGENSRLRPDMIIKLPGKRSIIVDAKAPIDAYMTAVNSGEEKYLEAHTKHVKDHIRKLGQKAYWEQFDCSPEFVIMFLPGESFFSSAIKIDPSLIEFGVSEKVIISTPISLIAILKAISYSWQQEAVAENAKKIGEAGRIVVLSLEKLFESSKEFEKKMVKNVEECEKINRFIEKTLSPAANQLKNLGLEVNTEERMERDLL